MDKTSIDKVKWSIRKKYPITCTIQDLDQKEEDFILGLLKMILDLYNKSEFCDQLFYCLKELIINGQKANYKRLYFDKYNYDLDDSASYYEGIEKFKEQLSINIDQFKKWQREAGLYVRVSFLATSEYLDIWVRNNSLATEHEIERIHKKIQRANEYTDMQDALLQSVDDEEGAGLGIIILSLMLKKIGVEEEGFLYHLTEEETQIKIRIPFIHGVKDSTELLYRKLSESIETLPTFPEHIIKLENLIKDENSSTRDISQQVLKDKNLTANVLKLANSPVYGLSGSISDISDAIKIIGLGLLENLLYTTGVETVFNQKPDSSLFKKNEGISQIVIMLAKEYDIPRKYWESAFLGSLLHDIGSFSFDMFNPGFAEKFSDFCRDKQIPVNIYEEAFAGYSYAEIGALLAKKWNFPDSVVEVIEYHNYPAACKSPEPVCVYLVHLAINIYKYSKDISNFNNLSYEVKQFFSLNNSDEFKKLCNKWIDTREKKTRREETVSPGQET
ncbi:HDOD domain-containing protein [Spirochaeta cellobiosiphila]|uniref:HDOD domain-containing protein n=1 Tax=Spirochaeta cellobiosiphila TaxID=504483 RepID=UPI000410B52D|nr:HDOD domain-containing protein [Spirochaeta cellobiosiphila]